MAATAANLQGNDPAKKREAVDPLASAANRHETSLNAFVPWGETIESNDVVDEFDLQRWTTDGGYVPPEL